jgi:hypothetical protein
VQKSIEVARALMGHDDQLLCDVERSVLATATSHDALTLYQLRPVPGSGEILNSGLLDDISHVGLRVSIRQQQDHASPPYQPCRPCGRALPALQGVPLIGG